MHNNETPKRRRRLDFFLITVGVVAIVGTWSVAFFRIGWEVSQQAMEPSHAVADVTDPVENGVDAPVAQTPTAEPAEKEFNITVYEVITEAPDEEESADNAAIDEEALAKLLVDSTGITTYFMPEYELDPLDNCELEAGSVYRVALDLPDEYLTTVSRGDFEEFKDNRITGQVYYPSSVKAGDTGRMVILLDVNDQKMVGVCDFVAKADMALINGDNTVSYDSAGGDVWFDDGRLELRFYTGADDSFDHPQRVVSSSANYVRCNFHAY